MQQGKYDQAILEWQTFQNLIILPPISGIHILNDRPNLLEFKTKLTPENEQIKKGNWKHSFLRQFKLLSIF
jgi:hypothetical protein